MDYIKYNENDFDNFNDFEEYTKKVFISNLRDKVVYDELDTAINTELERCFFLTGYEIDYDSLNI